MSLLVMDARASYDGYLELLAAMVVENVETLKDESLPTPARVGAALYIFSDDCSALSFSSACSLLGIDAKAARKALLPFRPKFQDEPEYYGSRLGIRRIE